MALAERIRERLRWYQRERTFRRTPEPEGGEAPSEDGQRFVVQHHASRHPHYDLRFEADGVLVSWAVPRGPTLDPDARRLAIRTEDHPLSYIDFEGVIPEGEYGAGAVTLWDHGTFVLGGGHRHLSDAIEQGTLRVRLQGHKIRGRFVLLRRDDRGPRERWLLIHADDAAAVRGWDAADHPRSVTSGRTSEEIQADPDDYWTSSRDPA